MSENFIKFHVVGEICGRISRLIAHYKILESILDKAPTSAPPQPLYVILKLQKDAG